MMEEAKRTSGVPLERELKITDQDIYYINGPLDLTFLMKMYALEGFDHLKEKPYVGVGGVTLLTAATGGTGGV